MERSDHIHDFLFGQNKLKVTDSYIYLGTNLNYNGMFNKAITKQVNLARLKMNQLFNVQNVKQLMDVDQLKCGITMEM